MVDRYLSDALKARGLRSIYDFNDVGGAFGGDGYDIGEKINYALTELGGVQGVFLPPNYNNLANGWRLAQSIEMPVTRGFLYGVGKASKIMATSDLTGPMITNGSPVMMLTSIKSLMLDGGLNNGVTNEAVSGCYFDLATTGYTTSDPAVVVDARNSYDDIEVINCPGHSFYAEGRGESRLSSFGFQNCGKSNLVLPAYDWHVNDGFCGESGFSNVIFDTSGDDSESGVSNTAGSSILASLIKSWWAGLNAINPASGAVVRITNTLLTSLFGYVASGGSKTTDQEKRKMEYVYIHGGVYTDPTGQRWPSVGAYAANPTGLTGVAWGQLLDAADFWIKCDNSRLECLESQDAHGVSLRVSGKRNQIGIHLNQGSANPRSWYNNQPWIHFDGGDVTGGDQRAEDNYVDAFINDQNGTGLTESGEAVSFYVEDDINPPTGFTGTGSGTPQANTVNIRKIPFARATNYLPTRLGYLPFTGFASLAAPTPTAKSGGNTGNGTITMDATEPVDTRASASTYTVRCTVAAANGGTFEVKKGASVSAALASAAIGTVDVGATFNNQLKFVIADGSTDFVVGDGWDIVVAQGGTSIAPIRGSKGSGSTINKVTIDDVAY